MKKLQFIIIVTMLLLSCSASKHVTRETSGNTVTSTAISGDGSSFDNAIVIQEKSETTGVSAEYAWLKKNYPGYSLKSQSLVFHHKKPYDTLDIVTKDGEDKTIYFDISNFFGKF